jgi:glycosyltransferase involved in cell wall biosynthesis
MLSWIYMSNTALIMCTYIRFENLKTTLDCIRSQTNQDFDFYIVDNSNKHEKLLGYLDKFGQDINIRVYNYGNDFKQFARFVVARDLAEQGYEKIIFIDDDEIIPNTFIQECHDQYEPEAVKTFWAHMVESNYKRKIKLEKNEVGNYAGTGGLVCSSSLFLNEDFFDCPEEYWIIDDLWLSFYILSFTNLKIKELKTNIKFIKDAKATFLTLGNLKQEFSKDFIIPVSKSLNLKL